MYLSTYLLQYRSDVLQRQRRKLILLQEVVQVLFEHFEHQTRVIFVLEAFEGSDEVEFIGVLLAETRQDGNFDLALACIRRMILEDFDGDDVAGAFFPALNHLPKRAAAKKLEDLRKKNQF